MTRDDLPDLSDVSSANLVLAMLRPSAELPRYEDYADIALSETLRVAAKAEVMRRLDRLDKVEDRAAERAKGADYDYEHWDARNEYIVTMDGKPVGMTITEARAKAVVRWLGQRAGAPSIVRAALRESGGGNDE